MDETFDVTVRTRSGAEHKIVNASKDDLTELRTLTEPAAPGSTPLRSTLLLGEGKSIDILRSAIESVEWHHVDTGRGR